MELGAGEGRGMKYLDGEHGHGFVGQVSRETGHPSKATVNEVGEEGTLETSICEGESFAKWYEGHRVSF